MSAQFVNCGSTLGERGLVYCEGDFTVLVEELERGLVFFRHFEGCARAAGLVRQFNERRVIEAQAQRHAGFACRIE